MIDYDTDSRIQAAREHADRLAAEILRARSRETREAGDPGWARLGAALAVRVGRVRRRRHAPAFLA